MNQDEAKVAAWLASMKDGDRQRHDVQHRCDDGTVIDVELDLRVVQIDADLLVFASGRDITAQTRLRRERTAMLESDIVGMSKSEHGQLTWSNQAFRRMFGYGPEDLGEVPVHDLYGDVALCSAAVLEADAVLREGRQYRTQLPMRRKDGEPIWIDISGARVSESVTFWMTVDITAMKLAHEELAHAAFHDPLTHLPNRRFLFDRLRQGLAAARREGTAVAVCFVDLDGFKAVNDEQGHEAGDLLLQEVARRLTRNIRPFDIAARLGGDEFVLVLGSMIDGDWRNAVERLVNSIQQPIELPGGLSARVGATVGVAISNAFDSAEALMDRADQAMLMGKRSSKGVIVEG